MSEFNNTPRPFGFNEEATEFNAPPQLDEQAQRDLDAWLDEVLPPPTEEEIEAMFAKHQAELDYLAFVARDQALEASLDAYAMQLAVWAVQDETRGVA